jgi:hypothetical protein
VVGLQAVEPGPGLSPAEVRLRLFGQGQEARGVAPAHLCSVSGAVEALGGVLAHGLQQPVAGPPPGSSEPGAPGAL